MKIIRKIQSFPRAICRMENALEFFLFFFFFCVKTNSTITSTLTRTIAGNNCDRGRSEGGGSKEENVFGEGGRGGLMGARSN